MRCEELNGVQAEGFSPMQRRLAKRAYFHALTFAHTTVVIRVGLYQIASKTGLKNGSRAMTHSYGSGASQWRCKGPAVPVR